MEYCHNRRTNKELKQIAKDLYNNNIFTSMHLSDLDNIITHFLPLAFLKPTYPTIPKKQGDLRNDRHKTIEHILTLDDQIKEYKEKSKKYNRYVKNIGFVYANYKDALPGSINGNPTFFTCTILTKADANKMLKFYKEYKELVGNLEKNF